MKKLIIDGRLGRDAETRTGKDNRTYLTFSLAYDGWSKGQAQVEWYDVFVFSDVMAKLGQRVDWLKKGRYVILTGNFEEEINVGRDGRCFLNRTIVVDDIELPKSNTSGATKTTTEETSTGVSANVDGATTVSTGVPANTGGVSTGVPAAAPITPTTYAAPPMQNPNSPAFESGSDNDDDLPF